MSSTAPEMRQVRLGDLQVDHHVQRNTKAERVEHIARNFNMEAFGVITVSERADGTLYIIDGAHRSGAGTKAEGENHMVPAMVYTGLTVAQEADMFLRLNDSKQVQPLEKFKVRLVAGDPDALLLDATAEAYGWHIGSTAMAIGSYEEVYYGRAGGMSGKGKTYPLALANTFECLALAWGPSQEASNGHLFKGVGAMFLRNPSVEVERLAARMLSVGTAAGFLGQARSRLAGTHNGLHKAAYEVAAMVWNKRLSADNQIPATF